MLLTSSAQLQLSGTENDDDDIVGIKNEFGFGVDGIDNDPGFINETVSAASARDFSLSPRGNEDEGDIDGDNQGVRKPEIELIEPHTEQLSPILDQ